MLNKNVYGRIVISVIGSCKTTLTKSTVEGS